MPVFAPERSDRNELLEFRDERLRAVVEHAATRVAWYRRSFAEHGVDPADVRSADDLSRLPILERSSLQEAPPEAMVREGPPPDDLTSWWTSGSSGRPVTIRRTEDENRALLSVRLRLLASLGKRPFDMHVKVKLAQFSKGDPPEILRRIFPQAVVHCGLPPRDILDQVVAHRPRVLSGYPGALNRIAPYVTDADRNALDLRFVLTGGETLTPHARAGIGEGFGADVYDNYGSHEFGAFAGECPETGLLHVADDSVVLEVLGDDDRPVGEGEAGEAVVTGLHSLHQPFVRYRLGDIVTRGPERCPCGAPWSTLASVQGRSVDYFHLPGGRVLHPFDITIRALATGPWIRQYRLVQERRDRVVLRIVTDDPPPAGKIEEARTALSDVLGPTVEVEVEPVDELALEETGKFRIARSYVHE